MNLYCIWNKDYEWCCFVFETTRNRAKHRGASYFGERYIDMRCQTLKKGVNMPTPHVVDDIDAPGYDMVLKLGYSFAEEE